MSKRLKPCVFLPVVAGLLVSASPAHARIVPEERRIGKVELFMRTSTLRDRLGPPDKIKRVRFDVRRFIYRDEKLRVDVHRKLVTDIYSRNPRERTRAGSGVGSTRRELERAEDDRLHCGEDRVDGNCWIQPRGRHSAYHTYFLIENRRVVNVVVREAPRPL